MLNIAQTTSGSNLSKAFTAKPVSGDPVWFSRMLELAGNNGGDLISHRISIGPSFAKWLLDNRNDDNRPLSEERAKFWAAKIKSGRFRFHSQGISFSKDGVLNNGQHRLLGIVISGQPADLYVTFGEDRAAFEVLDSGRPRGAIDTLSIQGHKNAASLAAGARLLKNIERGAPTSNSKIDNDEFDDFIKAHDGIDDVVFAVMPLIRKLGCSSAAAIAAIYLIVKQSKHCRADEFVEKLIEGTSLPPRKALIALRDALQAKTLDAHVRGGGRRAPAQAAGIINAWNLWVHDRNASLAKIRWTADQPFPRPE